MHINECRQALGELFNFSYRFLLVLVHFYRVMFGTLFSYTRLVLIFCPRLQLNRQNPARLFLFYCFLLFYKLLTRESVEFLQ